MTITRWRDTFGTNGWQGTVQFSPRRLGAFVPALEIKPVEISVKGGRITCSSGSHNLQVLEGGTGERRRPEIQPWDYNSWSKAAWRKGPVRKFIYAGTGSLQDGSDYRAISNFE